MSRNRLQRSQVGVKAVAERVSRRPKPLDIQEEPPQSSRGQALHEDT